MSRYKRGAIKAVAIVLASDGGGDPMRLEPGSVGRIDGIIAGGPAFQFWRLYEKQARKIIRELEGHID